MENRWDRVLIVIVGPTGSGKSDLAVELARLLDDAPVLSTDSRQVFRGMAIGTAQPSEEQLNAARHYFIADRDVTDGYTAGQFEKEALSLLDELWREKRFVIAVGGSGLYVDALCEGFDSLPRADERIRAELSEKLRNYGLESLLEELRERDPEYYDRVDRQNQARVMRALEVCRISGAPYSQQRSGRKSDRDFRIVKIGVTMPREELYERINRRVDIMMEQGLEKEARALYLWRDLNSLQTVGYRELFDYFDGKTSLEDAVGLIKRNSRRYAKRQMTWFNRDLTIKWFEKKSPEEISFFIKKFVG